VRSNTSIGAGQANARKSQQTLTPFLLLCLIGFAAFFSSYLRIPVMPLFAATLGAGPAQVGTSNLINQY